MNLVNAGLKSKEELKERLEAGEVFWYHGEKIFYDESLIYRGRSPFAICENALNGTWECYLHLEKEVLWHENIEKPVLCWVSDMDGSEKFSAEYVARFCDDDEDDDDDIGYFIDIYDVEWRYATPVTPEDLTKD